MSQNRSTAVMQRRVEPVDSLDDFPTPTWAVRALCQHVISVLPSQSVWEPACNRGYMVRGLRDYSDRVIASDIHDYGGNAVRDFLFPGPCEVPDWVITNPPFRLAEQFAFRALEVASTGAALLVRTSFIEGTARFHNIFAAANIVHRPLIVAQFSERVPMIKGRVDQRATTATSYCWVVWVRDRRPGPTELVWIPPCRRLLEKEGDYA